MTRTTLAYPLLLTAVFFASSPASGALLQFTLELPGGFPISINGGPLSPSGPLKVVGFVDSEATDHDPRSSHAAFHAIGARFTGAGFVDREVVTDLELVTFRPVQTSFAFQRTGENNEGVIGWNGESLSGDFMTDVNDLSTLGPLPYSTSGLSTFWYDGLGLNAWELAGGVTIGADVGNSGPVGRFSISRVPEPTTLIATLLATACAGVRLRRR